METLGKLLVSIQGEQMQFRLLLFLIWTSHWWSPCKARQNSRLFYYETLSEITVKTRAKRSSPTNATLEKELHFKAFQRSFHLSLISGSPVLARTFRARMVHAHGGSTWFALDQSKLFTGHVVSNQESMVSAHLEGNLWNIHILEPGEAYSVEPAWRLLSPSDNPSNDTMVMYRLSDVRDSSKNFAFCNSPSNLTAAQEEDVEDLQNLNKRIHRSLTKDTERKNTCILNIVIDVNTFNKRCRRNHMTCSSMVIMTFQMIDKLYRESKFEGKEIGTYKTGIGVQIGKLTIHTEYNSPGGLEHYNQKLKFDAVQKLNVFAQQMLRSKEQFCLHHLFTEVKDPNNILGHAYTNVLCRQRQIDRRAYNSGVTSGTNKYGAMVPSLMTMFVVAHEVGHNFGSSHDPHTSRCAPENNQGGRYLMWSFSVPGTHPNNKKFSKCSLRRIGRNVPAQCFQARSELYGGCGNGVVDPGEQCDAGAYGLSDLDKCCTKSCNLREYASCSEKNDECCEDCQIAPAGKVCRTVGYLHTCVKPSVCTGVSYECPQSKSLPDGEKCGHNHVCMNGKCVGLCWNASSNSADGRVYIPCSCGGAEMCHYCCYDATDEDNPGECRSFSPDPRPDGTPCAEGMCESGQCVKHYVQNVVLLENYIHYVQTSSLTQFMRTNIVLVVVVLSLLVWVPAALVISHYDREHLREVEDLFDVCRFHNQLEDLGNRYTIKDFESNSPVQEPSTPRFVVRFASDVSMKGFQFRQSSAQRLSAHSSFEKFDCTDPSSSVDSSKSEKY